MSISQLPPQNDKGAFVREMFAQIAPRYDVTNRVMTGGMDERWRHTAIALLRAPKGGTVIDLCCGTGDIAFGLQRNDPTLTITGVDFCDPMLTQARARAREHGYTNIDFQQADVMQLPFEANAFDGATMGFSMRNVVNIDATLKEVLRVLRPGARFVNLDVSKAPNPIVRKGFNLYFYGLVPLIGGFVGGSRRAYSYLPQSLTNHPDARALQARFEAAGFSECGYRSLMAGTIAIHYGAKP